MQHMHDGSRWFCQDSDDEKSESGSETKATECEKQPEPQLDPVAPVDWNQNWGPLQEERLKCVISI